MPFKSNDLQLGGELLPEVAVGKIQLPDFQRAWKWDVERIRGLLASVSLGYPVGVVMLLEAGGDDTQFAERPVAGVELNGASPQAERLILDGQQRLTSLYQALQSGHAVDTEDHQRRKVKRWFYVNMAEVLDSGDDREVAIEAVPEDKVVRTDFGRQVVLDLSTTELECASERFPLSQIFDPDRWLNVYVQGDGDPIAIAHRWNRWNAFKEKVVKNFAQYMVPVITLRRDTPREAVCTVFEKVNTGGVVLDVFELLTATFAASHFELRTDWDARSERLYRHKVLRNTQSTDFLQAVTLLSTLASHRSWLDVDPDKAPAVSCRRGDILDLTADAYQEWADEAERGLLWAAAFLNGEMIFKATDVPYQTQLVPLAAIHAALGGAGGTIGKVAKIRRWFWCGVLGELYSGSVETRFANDLQQVTAWCNGGDPPLTVTDALFDPRRLHTLGTRRSAAYKGIYALLMHGGPKDWIFDEDITMASYHDLAVDIHHVFPKQWCKDNGVDDERRESIVNKTALSAKTNRIIGKQPPSVYVDVLRNRGETTVNELVTRMAQHQVTYEHLAADDFDGFFDDRKQRLLDLIGAAMGKPPAGMGLDTSDDDYELEDEDLTDDDAAEVVEPTPSPDEQDQRSQDREASIRAWRERREKSEAAFERALVDEVVQRVKTPEAEYARPILESLVELGGAGDIREVLDRVHDKMRDRLKPFDYAPLPSGKDEVRWYNTAKWCRNTLMKRGLMLPSRVTGLWEISDTGRAWLRRSE